jgi:hypothetical protein
VLPDCPHDDVGISSLRLDHLSFLGVGRRLPFFHVFLVFFNVVSVFFLVFRVLRFEFLGLLLEAEEVELFGCGVVDSTQVDVDVALSLVWEVVIRLAWGSFELSEAGIDRCQGFLQFGVDDIAHVFEAFVHYREDVVQLVGWCRARCFRGAWDRGPDCARWGR